MGLLKRRPTIHWKYLVYPGLREHSYKIYEDGSIYSTANKMWIKPYPDRKGYLTFSAWIDGKDSRIRLNRALAMMFIPKTESDIARNRDIVHFVDYDITNYSLSNLKWVSTLEMHILNDIRNQNIKKTPTDCRDYILRLAKEGYSAKEIVYALELKSSAITLRRVEAIMRSL